MRRIALILALCWPGLAAGDDAALILGNNRYDMLDRVPGAAQTAQAEEALRARGYVVFSAVNGRSGTVPPVLDDWIAGVAGADRLIAVLTGRFVTDGARTWMLLADAEPPRLASTGRAVSVETVLRVLAARPGQSVLLIGAGEEEAEPLSPFLTSGFGPLDIPQGVTVITGPVDRIGVFVRRGLLEPEGDILAAALEARLEVEGYLPPELIMMPDPATVTLPGDAPLVPDPGPDPVDDARAWAVAEAADDVAGYQAYLNAFPEGAEVAAAQSRIEAILSEPFRAERLAEEALGLTRDQRREVQTHLATLDFNPRGIDGIFGPGSRAAIQNWQQENGYPQSSYLTTEQLARLAGQAARRQAELEAEAEARRLAEERADRAFWDETGARGDEAGYRAYLDRYPEGLFSETATEALAEIMEARQAAAAAADRAAWDQATGTGTEAAYRDYLAAFPDGAFRSEAEAEIARLTQPPGPTADEIATAQAAEAALNLNPITARLVEAQLANLGLSPGIVDGRFDETTRTAIIAYQEARGVTPTGYLSEATIVRLLADSIEDLSRN